MGHDFVQAKAMIPYITSKLYHPKLNIFTVIQGLKDRNSRIFGICIRYSSSKVKWRSEGGGGRGQSINSSSLTKSIECGFVGGGKSREASTMSSQSVWFAHKSAYSRRSPFSPDVIFQIVATEPRTRPEIISNLSAPSHFLVLAAWLVLCLFCFTGRERASGIYHLDTRVTFIAVILLNFSTATNTTG